MIYPLLYTNRLKVKENIIYNTQTIKRFSQENNEWPTHKQFSSAPEHQSTAINTATSCSTKTVISLYVCITQLRHLAMQICNLPAHSSCCQPGSDHRCVAGSAYVSHIHSSMYTSRGTVQFDLQTYAECSMNCWLKRSFYSITGNPEWQMVQTWPLLHTNMHQSLQSGQWNYRIQFNIAFYQWLETKIRYLTKLPDDKGTMAAQVNHSYRLYS